MLDLKKPVQLRDGREAKILMEDNGAGVIVGAYKMPGSDLWCVNYWHRDGWKTYSGRINPSDLINVPQRIHQEYWANVYTDHTSTLHLEKTTAINCATPFIKARVKVVIDCEEGEGL